MESARRNGLRARKSDHGNRRALIGITVPELSLRTQAPTLHATIREDSTCVRASDRDVDGATQARHLHWRRLMHGACTLESDVVVEGVVVQARGVRHTRSIAQSELGVEPGPDTQDALIAHHRLELLGFAAAHVPGISVL